MGSSGFSLGSAWSDDEAPSSSVAATGVSIGAWTSSPAYSHQNSVYISVWYIGILELKCKLILMTCHSQWGTNQLQSLTSMNKTSQACLSTKSFTSTRESLAYLRNQCLCSLSNLLEVPSVWVPIHCLASNISTFFASHLFVQASLIFDITNESQGLIV